MRILVKVGGTLLDEAAARRRISRELAQAARGDLRMVVVHGGGRQMTRFLAERGVESRFVNGLRVTTPEVLDAVLKVFAGSVNHEFVAALISGGAKAVGLSGIDASLAEAVPIAEELGAVGRPVRCNAAVLETLTEAGYLPVVACVAGDRDGNIYNVNADQMAVACAVGFRAERLFFLTDVDGVRDASGRVIPRLDAAACERLIRDGVATGGMQAKLNAASEALRQGVAEIVIAPGAEPEVVRRLLAGEAVGSRVVGGRL
jgi:acetylglutamate kinase